MSARRASFVCLILGLLLWPSVSVALDGNGQDEVIIDFGPSLGIWVRRNDSSWFQLHTISAEAMVTGDMDGNGQDEVIIDFGPSFGIWVRLNDSSWFQLHGLSAEAMATGNVDGT